MLLDWPKIDPSYCYRCPWGKTYPSCDLDCATALEKEILKNGADTIAAFIAEPMMGSSGGVIPPVKEYWPKIREICTRYDMLLIADEVMTGFGRTGQRFAVDHWDVKPDILVGGKGLTGGYMPMGMIAVKETLVEEVERAKAEFMFYTYSSHPLACAVADECWQSWSASDWWSARQKSARGSVELAGRAVGASDGRRHPRHRHVLGNRTGAGQATRIRLLPKKE